MAVANPQAMPERSIQMKHAQKQTTMKTLIAYLKERSLQNMDRCSCSKKSVEQGDLGI